MLRSGRSVATLERGAFSSERLLELMSTREGARAERVASRDTARGAVALSARSTIRDLSVLAGRPAFDSISAPAKSSASAASRVTGKSRSSNASPAARRPASGRVRVARNAPIRSSRDAARAKIAFLPRDRKTEGILAPLSMLDNVTVSALGTVSPDGECCDGVPSRISSQTRFAARRR